MKAVAEGMAPKACRPFALFMKNCCRVRKGASKSEHIREMKRLGKAWKQLSEAERAEYRRQSQDLFREQRSCLRSHGIPFWCSTAGEESTSTDAAVEDAQPEQGSRIGKFQCWQEEGSNSCVYVGEGSYGCVLLSTNDVGRKAVIKVFKHSSREDDLQYEVSVLRRLEKELPLSCQCWFPEILAVEEERVPFPHIALDYAGPSLQKVLATSGPLSHGSACSFALQLKAALEAIHGIGIVHLDVKPGNVIWCEDPWKLKLIDFGMAEAFSRLSAASAASAALAWPNGLRFNQYVTGPYRPPELWGLKPDEFFHALSPSVDVWSYSCTLYEAVTGRILMSPLKSCPPAGTTKQVVQAWCHSWHSIQSKGNRRQPRPDPLHHFNLRLIRSGIWKEAIMKALNPNPKLRALPEAMPS
jgi:serine/threonine protein kinase